MIESQFPDIVKTVGVKPFEGTAYPKINVYEWPNKVGIVAEIPGLDKKNLDIQVENGVLTISGNKHNIFDVKDAKVLRKELKQSTFKRSFQLGDLLDGDKASAKFENGVLSIELPKVEVEVPKVNKVKIS